MAPPRNLPEPAGIGNCASCAYLVTGTPAICFGCAGQTIEALARLDNRCDVCDLPLKYDGTCGNPICSWNDRGFGRNYAIAMRSGVLEKAISRFKYDGRWGWRDIFARVLVGFLDQNAATFSAFDLIVASPTFTGEGGRAYDHTSEVVRAADAEAEGRWPFDDQDSPAILKTAATAPMVGQSWITVGKAIVVYDDVFTDGFTLREVARCLRADGGAREVCGVTLARQPFRG